MPMSKVQIAPPPPITIGPTPEETTWRNARRDTVNGQVLALDHRIDQLTTMLTVSIADARKEAQTANDALHALIDAAIKSMERVSDIRLANHEVVLAKTEEAIHQARTSASAAIDAADNRASLRHESVSLMAAGIESKITERLHALQQLIDLRATMNQAAVEKANEATDKRFEVMNGFRQTLSDQARSFVTNTVLDAKLAQIEAANHAVGSQVRTATESSQQAMNALNAQVAALTGKVMVGGLALMGAVPIIQLVINLLRNKP